LKFSLSSERRKIFKKALKNSNETLRILISSSISLAPTRSRRTLQTSCLEAIRQNACGVHDVLESGPWACTCSLPHNANLRLEARGVGDPLVSAQAQLSLPTRFRFVFSFDIKPQSQPLPPWNWHETDIEPLDDQSDQKAETTNNWPSATAGCSTPQQCHVTKPMLKSTGSAADPL
jgi:hypothetical protein